MVKRQPVVTKVQPSRTPKPSLRPKLVLPKLPQFILPKLPTLSLPSLPTTKLRLPSLPTKSTVASKPPAPAPRPALKPLLVTAKLMPPSSKSSIQKSSFLDDLFKPAQKSTVPKSIILSTPKPTLRPMPKPTLRQSSKSIPPVALKPSTPVSSKPSFLQDLFKPQPIKPVTAPAKSMLALRLPAASPSKSLVMPPPPLLKSTSPPKLPPAKPALVLSPPAPTVSISKSSSPSLSTPKSLFSTSPSSNPLPPSASTLPSSKPSLLSTLFKPARKSMPPTRAPSPSDDLEPVKLPPPRETPTSKPSVPIGASASTSPPSRPSTPPPSTRRSSQVLSRTLQDLLSPASGKKVVGALEPFQTPQLVLEEDFAATPVPSSKSNPPSKPRDSAPSTPSPPDTPPIESSARPPPAMLLWEWDAAYRDELASPLLEPSQVTQYEHVASSEQRKFLYALRTEELYWRSRAQPVGSEQRARLDAELASVLETSSPEARLAIELCINLTKALHTVAILTNPASPPMAQTQARALYARLLALHHDLGPLLYYRLARLALAFAYAPRTTEPSKDYLAFLSRLDEPERDAVYAMRGAFFDHLMNDPDSSPPLRTFASARYSRILMGRPQMQARLQQYLRVRQAYDLFLSGLGRNATLDEQSAHREQWLSIVNEHSATRAILFYELALLFHQAERSLGKDQPPQDRLSGANARPADAKGAKKGVKGSRAAVRDGSSTANDSNDSSDEATDQQPYSDAPPALDNSPDADESSGEARPIQTDDSNEAPVPSSRRSPPRSQTPSARAPAHRSSSSKRSPSRSRAPSPKRAAPRPNSHPAKSHSAKAHPIKSRSKPRPKAHLKKRPSTRPKARRPRPPPGPSPFVLRFG